MRLNITDKRLDLIETKTPIIMNRTDDYTTENQKYGPG